MNNKSYQYILDIYSDESGGRRFKFLSAISGLKSDLDDLSDHLKSILLSNDVKEIKFDGVRTHLPKIKTAKKFFEVAVEFAVNGKIRVDIIIWDLQDSRHSVLGRDDKENLERMYYHLLKNITIRWKIFSCNFYPDEHSEYDYQKIIDYLNRTKYPREEPNILKLFREKRIKFNFKEVVPQQSHNQPLIQLADLFAGFGCFSREKAVEFGKWKKQKENRNLTLFPLEETTFEEKKALINRFEILLFIKDLCERNGLKVSLNTNNYLKTYKGDLPINFWHYEPQGDYDKAPTKG